MSRVLPITYNVALSCWFYRSLLLLDFGVSWEAGTLQNALPSQFMD